MRTKTTTKITGMLAIGLIAAALVPAASAVASPVGEPTSATQSAGNNDAVFTAKLRRDPGAADPFFVQTADSGQKSTEAGDISAVGVVALIGGLGIAVAAIVMTGSAGDRRRTVPAQPGHAARIF